jgi:hypothetical protein
MSETLELVQFLVLAEQKVGSSGDTAEIVTQQPSAVAAV